MKRADILTAIALFAMLFGGYLVAALYFPMVYLWATYEDLFGEWTQFWLFVITFIVSAKLVLLKSRYRITFLLLALACFYVAMEEISWGQRVFNIETPDFFKEHNLQGETNLHNLFTGPFSTTRKALLAYGLSAAMIGYGLLYPILVRSKWRLAVRLDARGVAPPPPASVPFFVVAGILEADFLSFNEAEVAELFVGFAVTVMAIHYAFAVRRELHPTDSNNWSTNDRRGLAVRYVLASFVAISVAANTTLAMYATPSGRKRMESRIENGIEKFAGRYGRYGNWEMSVALLRKVHERKPTSRSTLRKLGTALANSGNSDEAQKHLRQAFLIDKNKLKNDPGAASVHRSIIRTYRLLGDQANAEHHISEALRIGKRRIEQHPDSSNAAYSLGLTYELLDRNDEALEQFERAYTLNPTSKKFKKAYLKAKTK